MKKALETFSEEEQRLRSLPYGPPTSGNLFEEEAGRFWDIPETRDYILARFELVGALREIKTYAAVNAVHEHCLGLLRLNRSDKPGVVQGIPALALRLGKNQECYDFCLWWLSKAHFKPRDWYLSDTSVKNADVLEFHKGLLRDSQLSHTVAITLLKIKLYLHLSALSKALVLAEKVPPELLNAIRDQMLSGTALACRNITMNRSTQASIIRELQSQIKSFYKEVNSRNHRFWPALLKPDFTPFGDGRNRFVRYGSVEEVQVVHRYSYDAWVEVPGAIDVVRKLCEIYLTNDIMEAAIEELYSR